MSAKLDTLMGQITSLTAAQDAIADLLDRLFTSLQREQLRETTARAIQTWPDLAHIRYCFGDDTTRGWVHELLTNSGTPIADWHHVPIPHSEHHYMDAFPLLDSETPIDDLLDPTAERTWEWATLDVTRILALT